MDVEVKGRCAGLVLYQQSRPASRQKPEQRLRPRHGGAACCLSRAPQAPRPGGGRFRRVRSFVTQPGHPTWSGRPPAHLWVSLFTCLHHASSKPQPDLRGLTQIPRAAISPFVPSTTCHHARGLKPNFVVMAVLLFLSIPDP